MPRAKSAQPQPPVPGQAAQAAQPPPATLHELLLPLAAAAMETSVRAYQWGLHTKNLLRAGVVMDLCGDLLRELNGLTGATGGPMVAVVPTPAAPRNGAGPAPLSTQ